MERLILSSGPSLTYRLGPDRFIEVTDVAQLYLFEGLRIEPGTTLGDLILLLGASPLLVELFARWSAGEVLAEVETALAATSTGPRAGRTHTLQVSVPDQQSDAPALGSGTTFAEPDSIALAQAIGLEGLAPFTAAGYLLETHPPSPRLTLGILLDAVLRSLSYFGSPSVTRRLANEIASQTYDDGVDVDTFVRELHARKTHVD